MVGGRIFKNHFCDYPIRPSWKPWMSGDIGADSDLSIDTFLYAQ